MFSQALRSIVDTCFIPIAAGGGIKDEKDAELLMKSGADKLVLNTALMKNISLTKTLIRKYGSQCIIASVDYKEERQASEVFINNGTESIRHNLAEYLQYLEEQEVGEIYLNSMDRDGTGQGYPVNYLKTIVDKINIPVILAGGAGKYQHFIEALNNLKIDAVATANLFNFIGNGFPEARDKMLNNGIQLAKWDKHAGKNLEGYFLKPPNSYNQT
ncbi:MAG: HisA/HisF-related TIM barrel protein [Victivallaceae bacterium]|nr:HisA/HisF-related TIM barrel protein [Victivallaceae bacterium]